MAITRRYSAIKTATKAGEGGVTTEGFLTLKYLAMATITTVYLSISAARPLMAGKNVAQDADGNMPMVWHGHRPNHP